MGWRVPPPSRSLRLRARPLCRRRSSVGHSPQGRRSRVDAHLPQPLRRCPRALGTQPRSHSHLRRPKRQREPALSRLQAAQPPRHPPRICFRRQPPLAPLSRRRLRVECTGNLRQHRRHRLSFRHRPCPRVATRAARLHRLRPKGRRRKALKVARHVAVRHRHDVLLQWTICPSRPGSRSRPLAFRHPHDAHQCPRRPRLHLFGASRHHRRHAQCHCARSASLGRRHREWPRP